MRRTVADAKNPLISRIPSVLNVSPTDSRLLRYINSATQRLLFSRKSWGTYGRFRLCITNGCVVFPRQFAAIEAADVCGQSLPIRNEWFEFMDSGPGIQGDCSVESTVGCGNGCAGVQLFDRGTAVAFEDIRGVNKKIRVYADVTEAADAKILLQGYDENSQWIRTLVSGVWVDGEYVLLSTTPQLSTKLFSSLTGVQKPITKGTIRLYEYNTDTTAQRAIAIYEPGETRPSYRKSLISGVSIPTGDDCGTTTLTVMAKLDFVPVSQDTDWLLIGNLEALTEGCQAVKKLENNLFEEAEAYEQLAFRQLERELRHHLGRGIVQPVRTAPREIAGGGVYNLV